MNVGQRSSEEQREKLAELLNAGTPVCSALEQAGWSEKAAAQGWNRVPQDVLNQLDDVDKLMQRGKMSLEELKCLVIGRLAQNAIEGKDGGVMSAKTLGSHRDLQLWQPENVAGIVVIQPPVRVQENRDKILEAEE